MEYTHLGKRLKKAREHKGYSAGQLATRVGVKRSTVEAWEAEKTVPRVNKLQMVAGILDVPLMWLLAGADAIPEPQAGMSTQAILLEKVTQAEQQLTELSALLGEIRVLSQNMES